MPLIPEELAALQRAEEYNGARFDASTNPRGLAGEGYKTNWPQGLNDTATLVGAVAREVAAGSADTAAAESAKVAAEAARAAAETALAQGEGARDAAQAAQTASEAARDVAQAARGGAEAAETAAEAAWESLDTRYLGALAADPTTDNTGDPLVPGALYFNTTVGTFRGWTGTAWQDLVGAGGDNSLPAGSSADLWSGYRLSADGSTVEFSRFAAEPSPDPIVLSAADVLTGEAAWTVSGYPAGFGPARVQAFGGIEVSVDGGGTWGTFFQAGNGTTVRVRPSAVTLVDGETYTGSLEVGAASVSYSFTYQSLFIATPSITSHADGQTDVGDEPLFVASVYDVLPSSQQDAAHPHQDTDWELYADAALSELVWSSLADATNKVQIRGPALTVSTPYFLRVRYHSTTGLVSDWSSVVSFTTAATFGPALLVTDDGYKVYEHDVDNMYNATVYVGTGAAQAVRTNMPYTVGDRMLTIIKNADSNTSAWVLVDTVRGASNVLSTNTTAAQVVDATTVTGWTNGGVTVGAAAGVNGSGNTLFIQTFKEADNFFKIATTDHISGINTSVDLSSLGTVGMVWVKPYSSVGNWLVWHKDLPAGYLVPQWGQAEANSAISVSALSLTITASMATGSYVVYAWAHDESATGLVHCGGYTGTGTVGSFVDVGFVPQAVTLVHAISPNTNVHPSTTTICDDTYGSLSRYASKNLFYMSHTTWTSVIAQSESRGFRKMAGDHTAVDAIGGLYVYMAICRGPTVSTDAPQQVYNSITDDSGSTYSGTFGFCPDVVWQNPVAGGARHFFARQLGEGGYLYMDGQNAAGGDANLNIRFLSDGFTSTAGISGSNRFHAWKHMPGVFASIMYRGIGADMQVPHDLGVVPEMVVVKSLSLAPNNWAVNCPNVMSLDQYINLEESAAARTYTTHGGLLNQTMPTSTVVYLGGSLNFNTASGHTYLMLLFASRDGVSKVGGFATDAGGNATVTGVTFRPRFLLVKRTDGTGDWLCSGAENAMTSSAAPGAETRFALNSTAAEVSTDWVDTLADGFVIKGQAASAHYIYLALA